MTGRRTLFLFSRFKTICEAGSCIFAMGSGDIRSATALLKGLTLILRFACFTAIFSHPTIGFAMFFTNSP